MGTPGHGLEFKRKAVQMSNQPGVPVKDVAEPLCIHPFMLSKRRKQVRGGELVGKVEPVKQQDVAELQRLREVERQFKRLQREHDLLKSHPVCLRSKAGVFAFIAANRQEHSVQMMCSLYKVTRAGFYAWCRRERSARAVEGEVLLRQIAQVHARGRGYYGSPRVTSQLRQQGLAVGRRRVAAADEPGAHSRAQCQAVQALQGG